MFESLLELNTHTWEHTVLGHHLWTTTMNGSLTQCIRAPTNYPTSACHQERSLCLELSRSIPPNSLIGAQMLMGLSSIVAPLRSALHCSSCGFHDLSKGCSRGDALHSLRNKLGVEMAKNGLDSGR